MNIKSFQKTNHYPTPIKSFTSELNNKQNAPPFKSERQIINQQKDYRSSNTHQQSKSLVKTYQKQTMKANNHTVNHNQNIFSNNCSKWLDSQKEMMEFILGLKSKKSIEKLSGIRKNTQGFQLDERRDQKEDYLCHKMLIIKRVEKHQKEAINFFYQKDYEKCFGELSKAEALLKKEKIQSPPHNLYLNYLHAQFYYKLSHTHWKIYLSKAKSSIQKIQTEEFQSMKHYIWSVKALQVCLALQNQQYEKILIYAEEFRALKDKASKLRRRVHFAQIIALQKLNRYKQALEVIQDELAALNTDSEIDKNKREQEIAKILVTKINLMVEFCSREEGIMLIEDLISFNQVSSGQTQHFGYYNHAIYELYVQLLRNNQIDKIKFLFFYQKWIEIQPHKKQKLKLQLQLFRAYFQIGIYQRALQIFQQISNQNIVYLGPDYLYMLAKIKHFQGQEKEAVSISSKIIDICSSEDSKLLFSFRILQFNLSKQEREVREYNLQKMLKGCTKTANYEEVVGLYCDYLKRRGQNDRALSFYGQKGSKVSSEEYWKQLLVKRQYGSKGKRC